MELAEERLADGIVVVGVIGDVDLGAGRALAQALERALDAGDAVVVDLRACPFIDSTGLNALLRAARRSDEGPGRGLAVCAPEGGTVRRLFALTRTHALLHVHDDVEAAAAWLRG